MASAAGIGPSERMLFSLHLSGMTAGGKKTVKVSVCYRLALMYLAAQELI